LSENTGQHICFALQNFETANNSIKKVGISQEGVEILFEDILRFILADL